MNLVQIGRQTLQTIENDFLIFARTC